MKTIFIFFVFCSSLLTAQEEITFNNSLKPGQKLIQTSIVETKVSSSSVFADTVPRKLIKLIQDMEQNSSFLSPGGNVEKTLTKVRLTTGETNTVNYSTPGQMEFLEFEVSPDSLEALSLKGLKVFFHENKGKKTMIDSVDLASMDFDKNKMDIEENQEWLKEYYLELVKNFFPSVNSIDQKLKIGEHFSQDVIIPNMMFPGPVTNHQTYTLKEIKNGKGIFEIETQMKLAEDVIKKADPLDPEFQDILYFAITRFDGQGKGRMIYDPVLGIMEQLELDTTTEMELLRFGGSTTTTIITKTNTSERTMPEDQLK